MMKKNLFLLAALFFVINIQAQDKANEIKLNIANTIAIASVEFGYERFIDDNQSVEAIASINDRFSYHSEAGSRKFNTSSYQLGYNYYFGQEDAGSGVYVNPFLKYRTGDFEVENELDELIITDMNAFILGVGAGYKFNFNDTFVLGPFVNIGRNFSDEVKEKFAAIEVNAGFNIGYRF